MFPSCFQKNYQIITVNWKEGAKFFVPTLQKYKQSISNARLVGTLVAQLLLGIFKRKNYPLSSVHCIGHSLGAHICGYVGKVLKRNIRTTLGRITGKAA